MAFPTTYASYLTALSTLFFGKEYNGAQKDKSDMKFINDFVLSNVDKKDYKHANHELLKRNYTTYIHTIPFMHCEFGKSGDIYTIMIEGLPLEGSFIAKGAGGFIFLGNDGFIYKFISSPFVSKVRNENGTVSDVSNPTPVNNVLKEIVIQKLLSLVQYTNTKGDVVNVAPSVYNVMNCTNSIRFADGKVVIEPIKPNTWNCVIKMEKVAHSFQQMFYEQKKNLIPMLEDFLAIQDALAQNHIVFNHCDMKHDNVMYNDKKQMQWIDFGYATMIVPLTFKEGKIVNVTLYSDACKMSREGNGTIHGYYQGKDILQLILTIYLMKYIHGSEITMYDESSVSSKKFIYHILHTLGLLDVKDGNIIYSPILQDEVEAIQQKFRGKNPPDWIVAYNYNRRLRSKIPVYKINNQPMKNLFSQKNTVLHSNILKTRNVNRVQNTNNLHVNKTRKNYTRSTKSVGL